MGFYGDVIGLGLGFIFSFRVQVSSEGNIKGTDFWSQCLVLGLGYKPPRCGIKLLSVGV